MRPNSASHHRPLRIGVVRQRPAHSPCSRLHARLAGRITADRWPALTRPFQPSPRGTGSPEARGGFAFCCGCSRESLRAAEGTSAPTCCFMGQPCPAVEAGRGVGKFLPKARTRSPSRGAAARRQVLPILACGTGGVKAFSGIRQSAGARHDPPGPPCRGACAPGSGGGICSSPGSRSRLLCPSCRPHPDA